MNDLTDSDSQDESIRESYRSNHSSQDTEDSTSKDGKTSSTNESTSNSSDDEDPSDNESTSNSSDDEYPSDNEPTANSSDDEDPSDNESTSNSSDDEYPSDNKPTTNSFDDEDFDEWNYNDPERNLKLFCNNSTDMDVNYSKFRPVDAFMLLFIEQLFELIWKQTNIYGEQKYGSTWIPINIDDIKSWIGLNILMGYHKLPSYKHYWSTRRDFQVPLVCKTMSRNLFTKILNNIHLADNNKMPLKTAPEYSKTYKIDEFLNILHINFKKYYTLGQYISIDESMIKFKGRSSMKQYLPMKPIKRGFKVWTLADSVNGYVYSFRLYTGKDPIRTSSVGEHVVKNMLHEFKFIYRQVYFDNYFTTPSLLAYLSNNGIYAAGTVRINRKHMPQEFCCSKKKMNRGDFEYITSGDLLLHKWMDKKLVFLLSNFHEPMSYDVIQRKEKSGKVSNIKCPTSIIDYNKYMRSVDVADQRKESYALDRKSKRFWLRIFFNFLNVTLSNAFIIFKSRTDSNILYLDFLSSITTSLIEQATTTNQRPSTRNSSKKNNRASGRKILFDAPKKTEPHLPTVGNRGRCALCSKKKDVHVSIYHCLHCKRAFCMNQNRNCFYDYHKSIL